MVGRQLFDIDALDDDDPFEIDDQAAHLFKRVRFGIDDIREVWESEPLFYPAKPPADWLMVGGGGRRFGARGAPRQAGQWRREEVPSDRLLSGREAAG